jgi:class 3 adenylate cyclase/predicted ATPase
MTFEEILDHALALLQRRGRVTYRTLKRQFQLDEGALEDLRAEIIKGQRLAVDEDGEVLVWVGGPTAVAPPVPDAALPPAQPHDRSPPVSPIAYTPQHLAERILAEQAALEARGAPNGERKTITALFADIKGSMALLEGLDPEDARRLIDPALRLMMQAVHRYEGYVAQSLGDGIFALFGAPIAHEDHAQRALYAALRMQEEGQRYAEQLRREHGITVLIRVGVNTGEAVVRSIRTDNLHTDYVPIGHATSVAARLESLAAPGSILVSEPTYRLTEGYFEFRSLGAAQVKGVSRPVPIYEVLGVGPLRTRLQVSASRGLVRFVGRQRELEQLRRALELAQEGRGQVVAVVGEPGVGKSRLCYEFKHLAQRSCLVLETFAVSHGKASPLLPVIDLLKAYLQITPQDDERRRRERVTGKVLTLDRRLEDTLPYLSVLLGVAEPTSALAGMDPEMQRRRTFEAMTRLLLRESLNQPLLVLVEDLHWLDRETEAWLHVLSERVAAAHILLLVNYRPEYRHGWHRKTYYTQLRLDPLGREEAHELLTALLGDGAGVHALTQFILAKTEGNPFFMEEIVKTLLDQHILVRAPAAGGAPGPLVLTQPLTEGQLPPTVQGVLAARIDRLPVPEKTLLQTLAVIGKAFPLSLVAQVVGQPEDALQPLLARLQEAEFIYEQPAFPEPEYTFKHALTQEVAYHTLLQERRRDVHERTAQAIETLFRARVEDYYSELAHHYRRSGNLDKAVAYLQRAGQQAMARSAHADAIEQLTAALELLTRLPESPARAQQELDVQTTLGPALMHTQGYAAPEVEHAYARARALCQQLEVTSQLFPVLWGLAMFSQVRGEFQTARALAEQLMTMAQRTPDAALLLQAHRMLASSIFWSGDFALARGHAEQGLALYDRDQHPTYVALSGQDPGIACLCYATWTLLLQGYPDQALQRSQEVLRLAQELAQPHGLAMALSFTVWLHYCRAETPAMQEQAAALLALAHEHGFPLYVARGLIMGGRALVEQGYTAEGIAQMRQGLSAYRATGAAMEQTHWLTLLAEAYGRDGQVAAGLAVLADALEAVHTTGAHCYVAELYRLKGELLLAASATQQTEGSACFRQALDIARDQQAKFLELRAATSLARLWQRQGKRTEARELLAPIYSWFTEGFDTADLQDAKALLEEVSA